MMNIWWYQNNMSRLNVHEMILYCLQRYQYKYILQGNNVLKY